MMSLFHVLRTYMNSGGIIMWFILGVSLIVWYIGIKKATELAGFRRHRRQFLERINRCISDGSSCTIPGGSYFNELSENIVSRYPISSKQFYEVYRQFLMDAVPYVERGLSTMAAWVSVAPLLGLLGTVTGMIETFRIITKFGAGNPTLTAEGISIALLTTQAGLTVAFPAMLLHNFLVNRKDLTVAWLMKDGEDIMKTLKKNNRLGDKDGQGE